MRAIQAEIVDALTRGEGQSVDETNPSRGRGERRFEHEGPVQVPPLGAIVADRCDRPVSRVGIEQPGEDRRAVVARETEPIDGTGEVDETRPIAVREQAVVANGPRPGETLKRGRSGLTACREVFGHRVLPIEGCVRFAKIGAGGCSSIEMTSVTHVACARDQFNADPTNRARGAVVVRHQTNPECSRIVIAAANRSVVRYP